MSFIRDDHETNVIHLDPEREQLACLSFQLLCFIFQVAQISRLPPHGGYGPSTNLD